MTSNTRSFFASSGADFITKDPQTILGALAIRVGLQHAGDESQQIKAWQRQIALLQSALSELDTPPDGILLELPLFRLERRIDAIIIANGAIICLEFKIGSQSFGSAEIAQTVDYALCLRDFHSASDNHNIYPVLCADSAPDGLCRINLDLTDDVTGCTLVNGEGLSKALQAIISAGDGQSLDWEGFDAAPYNPTPNIVSTARALYAGHSVEEIGRADASSEAIERTATKLREIARDAKLRGRKVVCFVTGEPGSGKTLLGLDLVFSKKVDADPDEPAALLSGNRPLVFVLQAAIAEDARDRLGITATEAKRQAQQALQTLLGYLKDHAEEDADPPEHVIVFDEAQRAWDAETGLKLLGRRKSEPELFLEIMGRLDWACLVCLVGPGQEINRGEGGLALWGEALRDNPEWDAHVSNAMLRGEGGLTGLLDGDVGDELRPTVHRELHLQANLRAHRNPKQGRWVGALLAGDIKGAAGIAEELEGPPAYVTRDLDEAKRWLKARSRGHHRVGLLASSGAVRLLGEGVPPSPMSNELDRVVHWFLRDGDDFRSSNALEVPLSEFVSQGLEIDYACLCWGNDLIWSGDDWQPRKMRAPRWTNLNSPEASQYRINAYRVLLTRARVGNIIFVPNGSDDDPTLRPAEFDQIYTTLMEAGCSTIAAPGEY
ncbi:DNA/RNA helicase domain-containing protein [Croceicoccus sp. Ery5]|uniref:DNA/RNA helicase domain-containing protein n=1 Tax=Croceicoccus sp. Ery5 TaxID=1703340 RepID=UPI001E40D53E|nr:DNA/RNA helicase domain-containing protein [Croceicoccus sp. Ery5]